jgi:predicted RNA polymerase sigma factor
MGAKRIAGKPYCLALFSRKNKTIDFFRHHAVFTQKIVPEVFYHKTADQQVTLDLSNENIQDSQLQMLFAICHPSIPAEAQIGLCLNVLCGFGAEEIADAFLTNKEAIYKRLARAKENYA